MLQQVHRLTPDKLDRIEVHTFHEAVRLNSRHPQSTEQAQYSLPFPLAAALVHNHLGAPELSGAALTDSVVLKLSDRIELFEDNQFSTCFPAQRFARVIIETKDGERYDSGKVGGRWNADDPPSDQELVDKFSRLVQTVLPDDRAAELGQMIWQCPDLPDAARLLEALLSPPE